MLKETFIPEFIEVLTSSGWIEVNRFNFKTPILILKEEKAKYLTPKRFSNYSYEGTLVEIETERYSLFLKPSSTIMVNKEPKNVLEIKKGDRLDKYFSYQEVVNVKHGRWSGKVYSIEFEQDVYLPIKFEGDYSLLNI